MTTFSCWPLIEGVAPICPTGTCLFWFSIAVVTSAAVSPKLFSLSGFSQTRMAYCEPNIIASPTPETRRIGSRTLAAM